MNDSDNNIAKIIGNNIKSIRTSEKLSQERLAELIRQVRTLCISFGVAGNRGFLLEP